MKLRKLVVPVMVVAGILAVGATGLTVKSLTDRRTIIYENKDNVVESNALKSDIEKNGITASPIIYSNILIGGKYGNSIIDAKTFLNGNARKNIEISAFNHLGRMGIFKIKEYKNIGNGKVYAVNTISNSKQEYVAVEGDKQIANRYFKEIKSEAKITEAKKTVKSATSKYMLPNNSVQIQRIVGVSLTKETSGQVIIATSTSETSKDGVYSAIVYKEDGKAPTLVKLYYARKRAELLKNWPVYDLKFACDLNEDGVYELIIEEVTENSVEINVLELRKDKKFYQVISQKM